MFFKRMPLRELSECGHFGRKGLVGRSLRAKVLRTVKCGESIAGLLNLGSEIVDRQIWRLEAGGQRLFDFQ